MNAKNSNDAANRLLYIFIAIGILPLLMIWGIYLYNPYSPLLNSIAVMTDNLPAVMSAANPLMSKVMDVYCKTAPFWAFILFVLSVRKRTVIRSANRVVVIRSCLILLLFSIIFIYLFMFCNFDLTTSGGIVRYMSNNDVTLLIIYMGIYFALVFFTYFILFIPCVVWRLFKERQ